MSLIDQITDLAVLMYEESPYYSDVEIDKEDIKTTLLGLQQQELEGSGYFGVLYSHETPVGFLVATVLDRHILWGTRKKIAAELAWYVHPAFRKAGGASNLLSAFEIWARENKVDIIVNAAMYNTSYDQVKRIYENNGYKAGETAFFKRI